MNGVTVHNPYAAPSRRSTAPELPTARLERLGIEPAGMAALSVAWNRASVDRRRWIAVHLAILTDDAVTRILDLADGTAVNVLAWVQAQDDPALAATLALIPEGQRERARSGLIAKLEALTG